MIVVRSTGDVAQVVPPTEVCFYYRGDGYNRASLDWNGGKITERGVLLYIVQHIAQHLGQQIAYARSIGVAPPWTLDPPRKN